MKNKLYYLLFCILVPLSLSSIISCNAGGCPKPEGNRGTITIPIDLVNGSPQQGCEVFASKLLTDFKTGANVFGKSLKNDKSKWIIEFHIAGSCGPNTVWDELYKNGKWTPKIETVNGVEYLACKLPDLPLSSGDLSIDMTIFSPCITCSGGSFNRTFFSKSVRFTGVSSTVTPPEQIQFIALSPCN